MRILGHRILEVWERGIGQAPAEQALMLLAAACPGRTSDEPAALPLGTLDALLLTARQGCSDGADPLRPLPGVRRGAGS